MSEITNVPEKTAETAAESGNIMQQIQDMIGDLLKNAVDKMQQTEISQQLGNKPANAGVIDDVPAQMGIAEVKGFVDVMQKFIDNVNIMIMQIETGNVESGDTDEKFLEGYMATADNVLEIAAFSMKDSLTGLSNRYGFDNRLILEWNRATRDKSYLSLVIFGLDCYEKCDDTKKRDEMLKAVSDTLITSIKRNTDFIARWSDNDFAALLPITGAEGASIVAERIKYELGNTKIPGIIENNTIHKVSIGVSVHTPMPAELPVDFMNKAYDAYMKAKEAEESSVIFA